MLYKGYFLKTTSSGHTEVWAPGSDHLHDRPVFLTVSSVEAVKWVNDVVNCAKAATSADRRMMSWF